jgi:hypothetical protein
MEEGAKADYQYFSPAFEDVFYLPKKWLAASGG